MMRLYGLAASNDCIRYPERAITSRTSPTIGEARAASDHFFLALIEMHILAFAKSRNDNAPERAKEYAQDFVASMEQRTKLSEVCLFFAGLRTGAIEFDVYGTIEYGKLCSTWRKWYKNRLEWLGGIQIARIRAQEAEERKRILSAPRCPMPEELANRYGLQQPNNKERQ